MKHDTQFILDWSVCNFRGLLSFLPRAEEAAMPYHIFLKFWVQLVHLGP